MTTISERVMRGSVEEPAVHEAITRVLDLLPAIQKNGTAPGNMGGYKFRRVEDITAALKPLFASHGIVVMPNVVQRIESQRATAKGGVMFCVDLEIRFDFIGPKGDTLSANVWGQGTDSGDKATQKAVTSAFKTMLSVVFCISDSEMDAEAHDVPETARNVPEPAPKERVDQMALLVRSLDLTGWVKAQGFAWPWSPEACDKIEREAARIMDEFNKDTADPDATVVVPAVEPVMSRAESKTVDPAGDLAGYSEEPF